MSRYVLTDEQWEVLHQVLQDHPRVYVGRPDHCRLFLNAVLWILRSGSQWRSLPPEYGHWNSVFKRYNRWAALGVWEALFQAVQVEPDLQEGCIDSTVVRAHACAAGAKKVVPRPKL
ncbi:IS5 family transposase [Thiofilum flexile]|uniref:IS5 family transposase n=1 Tax=Thiofilum flexile TaxID=125627 RepID=UPI0004780D18|nr:IS5 family transposase [Thiofilum flexile]